MEHPIMQVVNLADEKPVSVKKRKLKEMQKRKLAEAHYLLNECNVPLTKVAVRLKIKKHRLRRIYKKQIVDHDVAFGRVRTHHPI